MKKQVRHYLISGRVQGVGYRAFVKRTAEQIGLRGTVKNLRDGRVEVLVEASESDHAKFESDLKTGPSHSFVEGVSSRVVDQAFVWENFEIAETGDEEWSQKA